MRQTSVLDEQTSFNSGVNASNETDPPPPRPSRSGKTSNETDFPPPDQTKRQMRQTSPLHIRQSVDLDRLPPSRSDKASNETSSRSDKAATSSRSDKAANETDFPPPDQTKREIRQAPPPPNKTKRYIRQASSLQIRQCVK